MPNILSNSELCDGCAICVSVCPCSVLELIEGKVAIINPENCLGIKAKQLCSDCLNGKETCIGCLACVRSCPTAAIELS